MEQRARKAEAAARFGQHAVKAADRKHLADFLGAARGERVPETQAGVIRERLSQMWNALDQGEAVRGEALFLRSAPTGHPDAFPLGDGVRRDGKAVLVVILEVTDGMGWVRPELPEGGGGFSGAGKGAPVEYVPAPLPPRPAPPEPVPVGVAAQDEANARLAASLAGTVCDCGKAKAAGEYECDDCAEAEGDIPF